MYDVSQMWQMFWLGFVLGAVAGLFICFVMVVLFQK